MLLFSIEDVETGRIN